MILRRFIPLGSLLASVQPLVPREPPPPNRGRRLNHGWPGNRYRPHQGEREAARRRRQIAKGMLRP